MQNFHLNPIIAGGCTLLVVIWAVATIAFFFSVWQNKRSIKALLSRLSQNELNRTQLYRDGLNLDTLDIIQTNCEKLTGTSGRLWKIIQRRIECYTSPEQKEGWFLTDSPRSFLSFDTVMGYRPFVSAVPGILTSIGLTLTFSAILLALLNVHYDKANTVDPITGIDSLINGLSGKFVSSIAALVLSMIFTLIERGMAGRLRKSYEAFITQITDVLPVLSSSRIMLDIHRFSRMQEVSLSNLSSDLVGRLTNAFNEKITPDLAQGVAGSLILEIRPTMERMVESLDRLQVAVVNLESQKQESLTGEIERMTKSLEVAITQSLESMGASFKLALSGSAKDEFTNAEKALGDTRSLLLDMNTRFESMQTAFSTVVSKAEKTTIDQLNAGQQQTEALTAVMHGLMNKLQETADQSLSTMHSQLTRVVDDLSSKVADLSVEMMESAKTMAGESQQSAATIMDKTDKWSESTSARLESLLASIEDRSREFNEAGKALLEAKVFMNNLLVQNANALAQMAEASRNVQAYSGSLAGQADSLKTLNQQQLTTSTKLQETVASLNNVFRQHEELLKQYDDAVSEFRTVIEPLDETIAKIMAATSKGLGDYNAKVEQNYDNIVGIANKLVPSLAVVLNQQIDDLREQLETLGDVIGKAVEKIDG